MAFHQESALGIVINAWKARGSLSTRILLFILIHCSCSQPSFLMEKNPGGMEACPSAGVCCRWLVLPELERLVSHGSSQKSSSEA